MEYYVIGYAYGTLYINSMKYKDSVNYLFDPIELNTNYLLLKTIYDGSQYILEYDYRKVRLEEIPNYVKEVINV